MKTITLKLINKIFSVLQNGESPVFISGHGRSGTTWIGETLKQAKNVCYYHEPCNPFHSGKADYSVWFRYIPPHGNDHYFDNCLSPPFKGLIPQTSSWSTHDIFQRLHPGYRVIIKEVASVMSLEWVYKRFSPEVLIVMRHPCAVALSEKKKKTPYENPIKEMLKQPALLQNHLQPYKAVMLRARKQFEIYGAVWGARNRVVADLIKKYPELNLIFYEDFCVDPINHFQKLFRRLNLTWNEKIQNYINMNTTLEKPGTYSTSKVTKRQTDKWRQEMTQNEVKQVKTFVEPFNLPFYNSISQWEGCNTKK